MQGIFFFFFFFLSLAVFPPRLLSQQYNYQRTVPGKALVRGGQGALGFCRREQFRVSGLIFCLVTSPSKKQFRVSRM